MNKIYFLPLFLLLLVACSEKKHTTSIIDISSSSTITSSSSNDNRLDIEYSDTLITDSTNNLSLPGSSSVYNIYLGKFPMGSGINLQVKSPKSKRVEYQVFAEANQLMLPAGIVVDESNIEGVPFDTLYRKYIVSGIDSTAKSNSFYTIADDYYYLTIEVDPSETSDVDIEIDMVIDTSKFVYIKDSIKVATDNKEHFVFSLFEGGLKNYYVCFDVEKGKATDLKSNGNPLDTILLKDSDNKVIYSGEDKDKIGVRLTPSADDQYCVEFKTPASNYQSPNHVFITHGVNNVDLPPGEYFSTADTIAFGDTIDYNRSPNPIAQYDVEYRHYMYLGNHKKDEFIKFWYGTYGLKNNTRNLVLLLDNENDSSVVNGFGVILDSVFSGSSGNDFVIPEDGNYYLRFISKGGNFDTNAVDQSVNMKMYMESLGQVSALDIVKSEEYVTVQDVIYLDSLLTTKSSLRPNVRWEIPKSDRGVIEEYSTDPTYIPDTLGVYTQRIKAMSIGVGHLVAVSVIDSTIRDTCVINVE